MHSLLRHSARVLPKQLAKSSCLAASNAAVRSASNAVRMMASSSSSSSSSSSLWRVDDPYTGEIVCEIPTLSASSATQLIEESDRAFRSFRGTRLTQRIALVEKWCSVFAQYKEQIALDITKQMGKPLGQARGEVDTCIKRARALIEMAPSALGEEVVNPAADPNPALLRKISKEPIGVVLALVPWNYPLLCGVNTLVAAVLAGNSVLIKHSDRTPTIADWFARTMQEAGAPRGLVQAFHADHALVADAIKHPSIQYVQFTGSVGGGRAVYAATAANRFIDVGLELGGKDPAYVAEDADLKYAIANVVDGGMYNAGQSCCAVERVYVHEKHYAAFLDGAKKTIEEYVLGDPRAADTSMGPIAQPHHVSFLAAQVDEARKQGARILTGGAPTKDKSGKGRFFQPTLIADCTHQMRVVNEESFGPLLAVMPVKSDEEAVSLMNSNQYGLTASVWSSDIERANRICQQLNTGTVFMNRCDFLDPYLAWSGRKDSGKGIGLSQLGFAPFVRTKSWNFRPNTQ